MFLHFGEIYNGESAGKKSTAPSVTVPIRNSPSLIFSAEVLTFTDIITSAHCTADIWLKIQKNHQGENLIQAGNTKKRPSLPPRQGDGRDGLVIRMYQFTCTRELLGGMAYLAAAADSVSGNCNVIIIPPQNIRPLGTVGAMTGDTQDYGVASGEYSCFQH